MNVAPCLPRRAGQKRADPREWQRTTCHVPPRARENRNLAAFLRSSRSPRRRRRHGRRSDTPARPPLVIRYRASPPTSQPIPRPWRRWKRSTQRFHRLVRAHPPGNHGCPARPCPPTRLPDPRTLPVPMPPSLRTPSARPARLLLIDARHASDRRHPSNARTMAALCGHTGRRMRRAPNGATSPSPPGSAAVFWSLDFPARLITLSPTVPRTGHARGS